MPEKNYLSGVGVHEEKAWGRIRMRAGLTDVRIHDLRHTVASWMVAQNYSLEMIGKALNQTNIATTARYAHLQLGRYAM